MKKDFLKTLKMLKFSINFKNLVACAVIFFGIGIVFELFLNTNTLSALSGIYMSLGGAYLYQMVVTPTVSTLVSSSPYKRRFQTIIPSFIQFITNLFTFTCFLLIRLFNIYKLQNSAESIEAEVFNTQYSNLVTGILVTAAVFLILGCYSALGNKKMIFSLICIFIFLYPLLFLMINNNANLSFLRLSLPVTIAISYGILILTFAVIYFLSLLLYRIPLDPASYKTALARSVK